MRKYLLIMSAGCIGWLTTGAQAACPVFPTCEEMGYTMTETDCSGRATLKCPSDHAKVFCVAENSSDGPVECQIGSVLYNDLKCYDTPPEGKTALGVVFDTSKRLAIIYGAGANNIVWSKSASDISTLTNCSLSNYTTCDTDGKSNTQKIVAALGESSDYAAGLCYTLTHGGLPKGSWFLPSASELKTLYNNKTKVNAGLASLGSPSLPTSDYYWSSTEVSSYNALHLELSVGFVNKHNKDDSRSSCYARCAVAY